MGEGLLDGLLGCSCTITPPCCSYKILEFILLPLTLPTLRVLFFVLKICVPLVVLITYWEIPILGVVGLTKVKFVPPIVGPYATVYPVPYPPVFNVEVMPFPYPRVGKSVF